jgi:hypothetical protein
MNSNNNSTIITSDSNESYGYEDCICESDENETDDSTSTHWSTFGNYLAVNVIHILIIVTIISGTF